MKVNIRIYSTQELLDNGSVETEYKIKIERDWIEKISSDGNYYSFDKDSIDILKKSVESLKLKYPNHKIIDKENILELGGKK